jgi:hypothetical protein
MKKWILLLFVLIFLSVVAIYVIIPSNLQISDAVTLGCSPASAARGLLQEFNWPKWLNSGGERIISTNDRREIFTYAINTRLNKELQVEITKGNQKWPSRLYIVPEVGDSISVKWQCTIESGINPFLRWKQYKDAVALHEDMHHVLGRLKSVLENEQNIYGFSILQTRVTDTVLIATRASFKGFPSTSEIYKLIHDLRKYINTQGAKETGFPMIHHDRIDSLRTETMVAIPVNKRLPEKGKFMSKRMVPGYILVAEVKGGQAKVSKAFDEMENYISDYQKQKIAISFESYVTSREATDSSSWITKVYFPIVK